MLTYRRKKQARRFPCASKRPLQKIIDRYDGDSPYVLPVLTADDSYRAYRQQQRELNKFIRKIGELLGISEPLTFYVARHSWATLARDCGTPPDGDQRRHGAYLRADDARLSCAARPQRHRQSQSENHQSVKIGPIQAIFGSKWIQRKKTVRMTETRPITGNNGSSGHQMIAI